MLVLGVGVGEIVIGNMGAGVHGMGMGNMGMGMGNVGAWC
jgi:hypothetical protein